jgi:hypothetical protein
MGDVMTFHHINGIKVRTSSCILSDWSAIDDDTYDADCDSDGFFTTCPIGRGATEQAAIADLMWQIEERAA